MIVIFSILLATVAVGGGYLIGEWLVKTIRLFIKP